MRNLRRGLACGIAACGVALAANAGVAVASQAEYDQGYELGTEAYKYGLPLVTANKTYKAQTSVNVSNGKGFGPANQFNPVRELTDPDDREIVAPNYDTLYSIAWLNLKKQPMVIHVPKVKDRYFVIPMLDPYSEDFKNLGTVEGTKPGDYAVVGPHSGNVKLPKGVKKVQSKYDRVFIIERTYVDNTDPSDVEEVHKIQDKITATPLNKYGKKNWEPKPPANPDTTVDPTTIPGGLQYFNRLGKELEKFPPPADDQAELDKLAQIGVGPGMKPSEDASLSADTKQGMIDAVGDGYDSVLADLRTAYVQGFAAHNGYLTLPTGSYGTDYDRRAMVVQVGFGALLPDQAMYPIGQVDKNLAPLNGSKDYVLHIPAGQLPPVQSTGFWSLTLYDTEGFLVPNAIDRYVINDRTDLAKNPDGSIDLYVSSTEPDDPAQAQNWLPSPEGTNFRLLWRVYQAEPDQIDGVLSGEGWVPPTIAPVS